jgi:1-acyl-sn-glycerol-3-phosphate acyltransferase
VSITPLFFKDYGVINMSGKLVADGLGRGLQSKLPKPLAKLITPPLLAILGIGRIDRIYDGACALKSDDNFAEKLLHKDVMNIKIAYPDSDLEKIPKEGPLVIVANHPYGGVDGIALLALLKRARPDVKLMANYMLGAIPELREDFFLVDPFGQTDSSRHSIGGVRDTIKWLKEGHVLGIFPAGEVAAYDKKEKRVIDKKWGDAVGLIIRKARCPVQSVLFEGHNSKFFQLLGRISPVLRTLWLPRECGRACNNDLPVRIGDVIKAETWKQYKSSPELMSFLKSETYALSK